MRLRTHKGVVLAFVADGGFRAMPGNHSRLRRKRVQSFPYRDPEICQRPARKVRAADTIGEERVPRQQQR